jgi:autotransporter-associated beta strand protein
VQQGTGTTTISENNTYTGTTTINAGTLQAGSGATSAFGNGTSVVTINGSGVLDLSPVSAVELAGLVSASPTSSVTLGSSIIEVDNSANETFAGDISGTSGQLWVVGSGTLTLSGTNSYTGLTKVATGTLTDGAANAFSSASVVGVGAGGTLQVSQNEQIQGINDALGGGGFVSIANNKVLTLNGAGGSTTAVISGQGGLTLAGTTVQGLGGNNSYSGGTTLTGTAELLISSNTAAGTGAITFNPNTEFSPTANVTLANEIILTGGTQVDDDDGSSSLTLTGLVTETGGTAGIEWCTGGTLTLMNANTFSGTLDMREGTLLVGNDNAAGNGGIILDSDTFLSAYGTNNVRTLQNPIDFTGSSAQLGLNDNNSLILDGTLSGGGTVTYVGGPTGQLTLNGSNTGFSPSSFTVSSGDVIVGNSNAFGSASSVKLTGGAGLTVETGVTVSNTLTLTGTANVLSGSGTIASPVIAGSTAVISPSASPGGGPGTLTFSDGLTLASGSAIHFDIFDGAGSAGTGYSLISATGTGLSLTAAPGTITFNIVSTDASGNSALASNFNPSTPYSWMFAASTAAITGFNSGTSQFDLVTTGFTNNTFGGTFSVTETGNDLFLNFTPVPEPSTWCLMGAGLLGVAGFSLRRRRTARA